MNLTEQQFKKIANTLFLFAGRKNSLMRTHLYSNNLQSNPYAQAKYIVISPLGPSQAEWWLEKNFWKKLVDSEAKEFFKKGFIDTYIAWEKKRCKEMFAVAKKLGESIKGSTTQKVKCFNAFFDYPARYNSYYYFAFSFWAFDEVVFPILKKRLVSLSPPQWEIIQSPLWFTGEQKYRIALSKAKKNDLHKIAEEFKYLGMYVPDCEGLTHCDVEHDYIHNVPVHIDIKQNRSKFNTFLTRLNPEEQEYCRLINFNLFYRTIRLERIMQSYKLSLPFFIWLKETLNFTWEQLWHITKDEVEDYLRYGNLPPKRMHNPLVMYYERKAIILPENYKKHIRPKVLNERSIQGMCACPGKAKGKAVVIKTHHDLKNIDSGDILIAYATRPEHIIAMKKSAAIVTNEGGMTCHAAIVSRELNKPCIIGTKHATHLFKTGDMVEVDADKGVVRKL